MRRQVLILVTASLAAVFTARSARAQQAQAEIVVPQINVFSVNTTVSVPDRGHMSLGGVRRAAEFREEYRPSLLNHSNFSSRSAQTAGAHVWIIDFREMEESLAGAKGGEPARDFTTGVRRYSANEFALTKRNEREPITTKVAVDRKPTEKNVAASSSRSEPAKEDAASSKETHAADLLKRGADAEDRGKIKVAAFYYKTVVSLEVGAPSKAAAERLHALEPKLAGR